MPISSSTRARLGACLLLLLSGSGALCYEVVWSRRLELTFGSTVQAVSTVLAVYMAGLGVGSWWGGRVADRRNRPGCVRRYALLELGIALTGGMSLLACDLVEAIALQIGPLGAGGALLRAVLVGVVLLPSTFMMGATLPLLVRGVSPDLSSGHRSTAALYASNTLGAVIGTVASAFWLIPGWGFGDTVWIAVSLSLVASAAAWFGTSTLTSAVVADGRGASPRRGSHDSLLDVEDQVLLRRDQPHDPVSCPPWVAAGAAFVFGACALGLELVWTRILGLIFGSSSAGFALALVGVLLGIALGSALASRPCSTRRAVRRLAALALAAAAGSSVVLLAWPLLADHALRLATAGDTSSAGFLARQLALTVLAVGPASLAFGAAFPLCAAIASRSEGLGRGIGGVYLANTAGGVVGAGPLGLWALGALGLTGATRFYAILLAGLALAIPVCAGLRWPRRQLGWLTLGVLCALWLGAREPDAELVDLGPVVRSHDHDVATPVGHARAWRQSGSRLLWLAHGRGATVSVRHWRQMRYMTINGKVDASTWGDMSTQVLVGVLPFLFRPDAQEALVVGAGSGVSVCAVADFGLRRVEVVEIEPEVIEAARDWFGPWNHHVFERPEVQVSIADGRVRLAHAPAAFDVIVSQPTNPWVAGVANLFTEEYYALARAALRPRGVLCQWIQLYQSDPRMLGSMVRTLAESFPHVQAWFAAPGDLILIASGAPLTVDLPRAAEALAGHRLLHEARPHVGADDAEELLGRFIADREALLAWSAGAEPLRDDRPRLEQMALANLLTKRQAGPLMREMLGLRDPERPLPPTRGPVAPERAHRALARVFGPRRASRRCLTELALARRHAPLRPVDLALAAEALFALDRHAEAREAAEDAARGGAAQGHVLLAEADLEAARWGALATRLRRLDHGPLRDSARVHRLAMHAANQRGELAAASQRAFQGLAAWDPLRDPESTEAELSRGLLALARGTDATTALALLEGLSRSRPLDWFYRALLGVVRLEDGDTTGAVAALESVITRERVTRDWVQLAWVEALARVGRTREANAALAEVRAFYPERVEALARLEVVLRAE